MRGLIIAAVVVAVLAGLWFAVGALYDADDLHPPADLEEGSTPAAPVAPTEDDTARTEAARPKAPGPVAAGKSKQPAPRPPAAPVKKQRKPIDPERLQVVSAFHDIPIEGATVVALDARGKPVGDPAVTDGNGQFEAPAGWEAGTLRIRMRGFVTTDFAVEDDHLVGDDSSAARALRMKPSGVIHGTVYDPEHKPLAWAKVAVSVLIDDGYGELLTLPCGDGKRLFTKNGGGFRVEGLDPRGRYLVVASLARLGVTALTDVRAAEKGPGIDVIIGGKSEVVISLEHPKGERVFGARATLVGRPNAWPGTVVADDVSRGYATLMKQQAERLERMAFSGRDPVRFTSGTGFYFPAIPAGTYHLEVLAKGYRTVSERITVVTGKNVSKAVPLEAADVALTGTVVGGNGLPVARAAISVMTDGSSFAGYRNATTQADGSFELRGPKAWKQPLHVTIRAAGYSRELRRVPVGQTRLDVKLLKNGAAVGTVRMEDRPEGPIVLEFVRSKPQPKIERRRFESRLDWKQFRYDLAPGMWTVRITAPGYRDHRIKSFEVRPGEEARLGEVTLKAK